MMKFEKRIRIILLLLIPASMGLRIIVSNLASESVYAVGDLEITHDGDPLGPPVFYVENMLPGDQVCQEIEVANNGEVNRLISVKGEKTGGFEPEPPPLEQVLELVITEDSGVLYGQGSGGGIKTVEDFFAESTGDGVLLSLVKADESTSYEFCVDFPTSAGNEYQRKSAIFDLIFGYLTGDNLVINEVYYKVDDDHGLDCPKDRGINAEISGNAAGSANSIILRIRNTCVINQSNTYNSFTSITTSTSTGGNIISRVTSSTVLIFTGFARSVTSVFNFGNINIGSCDLCCDNDDQATDEWIEIFNPTDQTVDLDDWILEDNSGEELEIDTNVELEPGEFALLSKDLSTWDLWDEDPDAHKIELEEQIGDGLDNQGDHLILKDPDEIEVDFVVWGDDDYRWDPNDNPESETEGSSIERLAPGFDTDQPSDWEERDPPTPGE